VTPGTLTEEKLLDPSAIKFPDGLGTGQGRQAKHNTVLGLDRYFHRAFHVGESRLARLWPTSREFEPRELILADNVFHDPEIRPLIDQIGRVAAPQTGGAV